MKKSIALYLLATLVLLNAAFSQESTFQTTGGGLLYKIYSDKSESPARRGNFLKYQVLQQVHDSVLFSSYDNMPIYVRVDSPRNNYSAAEIFTLLRKGDSAIVAMTVDALRSHFGGQLPGFLREKDSLFYTLKVLDVFTNDKQMEADSVQEVTRQRERETRAVEAYLADHHLQAEKTAMGSYVRIETVGHGPAIDAGKQVTLHFTSRLLPSGKIVQSNQTGTNHTPFVVVIGKGLMIPGMEDGLLHFREGGKGTIYIPAFLAYDAGRGPGGKTYEDFILDVEVDKVTAAPPSAH